MKTTFNELRAAYKAHIRKHVPAGRDGCPPEEEILRVFDKFSSSRKREKIIDHVIKCAPCHREFEFFLNLVRDENKAGNEISELLKHDKFNSRLTKEQPKFRKTRIGMRFPRFSLKRSAAVSIAFLAFVMLLLIAVRTIIKPTLDEERGKGRDEVRLIFPTQGQAVTFPLILRWHKVSGVQHYQLEIFDETLLPLWTSPPIAEPILRIPPDVEMMIEENKLYFWMVTAELADGEKRESQLEDFILKR